MSKKRRNIQTAAEKDLLKAKVRAKYGLPEAVARHLVAEEDAQATNEDIVQRFVDWAKNLKKKPKERVSGNGTHD